MLAALGMTNFFIFSFFLFFHFFLFVWPFRAFSSLRADSSRNFAQDALNESSGDLF